MKVDILCIAGLLLLVSCSEKEYLCHCESVYKRPNISMEHREETITTISAYSEQSARKQCENNTHTQDSVSTYDRTCKLQ